MLSIVMISGLFLASIGTEVFADKGGNGKAQGEPQGCDNGKGKDAVQNPNCSGVDRDSDGDGLTDAEEIALAENDPEKYGCLIADFPDWSEDSDGDTILDGADSEPCNSSLP